MPNYLFKNDRDEYFTLYFDYEDYRKNVHSLPEQRGQFINYKGQTLKRVYTSPGGHQSAVWPKRSLAAGVNPDQIKEQEKYDREAGLNTKYDPKTGDAIFRDMNHQRKHLKHHGLVERDSFI